VPHARSEVGIRLDIQQKTRQYSTFKRSLKRTDVCDEHRNNPVRRRRALKQSFHWAAAAAASRNPGVCWCWYWCWCRCWAETSVSDRSTFRAREHSPRTTSSKNQLTIHERNTSPDRLDKGPALDVFPLTKWQIAKPESPHRTTPFPQSGVAN
jgi:hypothetical protein